MARINLLPWRAELREERRKEFWVLTFAVIIGAVIVAYLANTQVDGQINYQSKRNQRIQAEITQLDTKIEEIKELEVKRERLLKRKEVIDDLQASRAQMVHLFDELVRTLPEGVYLDSIKQNGSQLTLKGFAQSNARVSAYMRNIDNSGWLHEPDLKVIEAQSSERLRSFDFTLQATIRKPGVEKEDEELEESPV